MKKWSVPDRITDEQVEAFAEAYGLEDQALARQALEAARAASDLPRVFTINAAAAVLGVSTEATPERNVQLVSVLNAILATEYRTRQFVAAPFGILPLGVTWWMRTEKERRTRQNRVIR